MEPPRNRKQRRAAAASQGQSTFDPSSIPMAHPSRDPANRDAQGKTLVDMISQRQSELLGQVDGSPVPHSSESRFVTIDPSTGEISGVDASSLAGKQFAPNTPVQEDKIKGQFEKVQNDESDPDASLPPVIDTVLLSVPLTTLHMTLAYLAAHQYAETIPLDKLIRESIFVAFPILTLVIHLAHGHIISFHRGGSTSETISLLPWSSNKLSLSFLRKLIFPPSLKTLTFLPLAVLLGAKLMAITNEDPYYAVMKQAPAIGTLWVWSILEIPVGAAVLGALGPMVWGLWWKGYVIF
ncbi:hypothetical protein FE257_007093 [Aspergillus nanangensis]|uniref:DUF7719 domain-containing protein n=1 Tax=Aspergillus nanangensis TaxID=2582783 RepID=A0AAD4GUE7_ASPNN|nr:hypothetical protein FE257_007093 [Aspergillus nanangensis]